MQLKSQSGAGYFAVVFMLILLVLAGIFGIGLLGRQMMRISSRMSNSAFGGSVHLPDETKPGAPQLIRMVLPSPGTYGLGETLEFTLIFSAPVAVRGPVSLPIETTSGTLMAQPVGETTGTRIRFSYEIKMLDSDRDGISLLPIALNDGGEIVDLNGAPALLGFTPDPASLRKILISGDAARVLNVTRPSNGTYKAGQTLEFIVKYSDDVVVFGKPALALQLGPNRRLAEWSPRAALNEAEGMKLPLLVFRYTIKPDDFIPEDQRAEIEPVIQMKDTDAIRDADGNEASRQLPKTSLSGLMIQNPPLPYGVTAPEPGNGETGDTLILAVTFTRAVKVEGKPLLPIQIGKTTTNAEYQSGSGTDTLRFAHVVDADDHDDDGISVTGAISLNGSHIQDAEGNEARLTLPPTRLPDLTAGPFRGYVAVGNYRVLASGDGQSWAEHDRGIGVARAVVWGHGRWVAVGDGAVWTSANATEWQTHSNITPFRMIGVATGPDGFMMTGGVDYWAHSQNGVDWSPIDLAFGKPASGLFRISRGYIAPTRAYSGAPLLIFSADGTRIEKREIPNETRDFRALAEGAGQVVMVGAGGAIMRAENTDGAWQPVNSDNTRSLNDISFADGQFVAVGARGTILTSPDGNLWTTQTPPASTRLNAITHGPDGFIAVGADGTILQSRTGTDWFDRSQAGQDLNDIAYGGNETTR